MGIIYVCVHAFMCLKGCKKCVICWLQLIWTSLFVAESGVCCISLDFDIFLEFIFFLFIFLNLVGFDVKPWHLRWCLSWVLSWRMEDLISFRLFLWNLELEIWWWLAVFEIQNPLKSIYNSWGKHCSLDER